METQYLDISIHLLAAMAAGGLIGLERSYHGRPAGFRTHSLVCLSSSLLMLSITYQPLWLRTELLDLTQTDPTRLAQGIMTGIGFLGAGVIFKEGLTVRGLTTAASIWVTAAIGVLIGIGFYFPAFLATVLTIGVLAVFRWIEARMPNQWYAHHSISFARSKPLSEEQLRDLIKDHGFTVANMSYSLSPGGGLDYQMTLRTTDPRNAGRLARALERMRNVRGFSISPGE
jgi:putative Mg2+ transporter-C (MgtC) family protein